MTCAERSQPDYGITQIHDEDLLVITTQDDPETLRRELRCAVSSGVLVLVAGATVQVLRGGRTALARVLAA